MSLVIFKGEGNGGIIRYKYRYRKEQPYLQRNVRRSYRSLIMGSTLSRLRTPSRTRSRDGVAGASDDEDEYDTRPMKRRKTSMFDNFATALRSDDEFGQRRPFGQVMNEKARAPRLLGKIQAVQPSDFYGKSCPAQLNTEASKRDNMKLKTSKSSIGDIVPPTPANFKKALRLEIAGLIHKDPVQDEESTNFAKGRRRPIDVKCRLSVALFFAKNDDNKEKPRSDDYTEAFRKLAFCTLRTTINDEGAVHREFINLDPFLVPAGEIFVNRKRNYEGQFTHLFDFAHSYYVLITVEPIGLQKEWPPFDLPSPTNRGTMHDGSEMDSNPVTNLLENGGATKNDLCLIGRTSDLLDPGRQNRSMILKLAHGSLRQKIPYALRLEMKWSLPSHMSDWSTRDIKIEIESPRAKISPVPATNESVQASPLARRAEDISAPNSPADRAQRRRSNVPTYNLKALSALQQGKSPRVRKSRDIRSRSAQGGLGADGTIVTYTFGKADSADLSTKRETTVTGLRCPFCAVDHSSLDDLTFHLRTIHDSFKFSLRRSNAQRIGFFVELAKHGVRSSPTSVLEQARTFQLSQPRSLFDLEKFLNGDESWVKAREGPQHNIWPEHLMDRFHESSLSSSPHESRHSSPNTSNDTDDVMDLENYHPKIAFKPRKKYYVPKTSKPLFNTVTKQLLEPGSEIPNSDDEKDESWLHQRHRDIVMDYEDVTDDEKDFIIRWNPFIMEEQLTGETHLSEVILRFVEANKFWFVERASRKKELAKTTEIFIMRGVVSQKCLEKCIQILRGAEKMGGSKEKEAMEVDRPVSPAKQRGALDCECGGHAQPPNRVICHGKVSFSSTTGHSIC